MKAILEFNLPEEKTDFLASVKGVDALLVLDDIKKQLREKLKYGELNNEQYKNYEYMRDYVWSLMDDYGLNGILEWANTIIEL